MRGKHTALDLSSKKKEGEIDLWEKRKVQIV